MHGPVMMNGRKSPWPTVGDARMPDAALSLYERDEISRGLIENPGVSWTELGGRIGRHRTTASREVTHNGGRNSATQGALDQAVSASEPLSLDRSLLPAR